MVFVLLLEMMRCIYLTRSILGNMLAKIGGTNMSVGRMQKVGGQGGGERWEDCFLLKTTGSNCLHHYYMLAFLFSPGSELQIDSILIILNPSKYYVW